MHQSRKTENLQSEILGSFRLSELTERNYWSFRLQLRLLQIVSDSSVSKILSLSSEKLFKNKPNLLAGKQSALLNDAWIFLGKKVCAFKSSLEICQNKVSLLAGKSLLFAVRFGPSKVSIYFDLLLDPVYIIKVQNVFPRPQPYIVKKW